MSHTISRRNFLAASGALAGSALISPVEAVKAMPLNSIKNKPGKKLKVALVGTGSRGCSMWGRDIVERYSDQLEFVGLSDINPGRLQTAKEYIGINCPVYTDFEKMMKETKPEL